MRFESGQIIENTGSGQKARIQSGIINRQALLSFVKAQPVNLQAPTFASAFSRPPKAANRALDVLRQTTSLGR